MTITQTFGVLLFGLIILVSVFAVVTGFIRDARDHKRAARARSIAAHPAGKGL